MKKNLPLSYIEISKKNLINNVRQFRSLVKKGTNISVAIKGNAYGHGQNDVARILEPFVDYFQVNSVEELELLREISSKETLLLGYIEGADLLKAIKLGVIISIFSIEELIKVNGIGEKLNLRQEIHIPVDAHLGREGFLLTELTELFREIKKSKYIKVSGIYAHFANIEDTSNFSHAQKQIREYEKALDLARSFGFKNFETHISATSGVLVYEKDTGAYSLVRLGLGAYGMWPSEHIKFLFENKITLMPVLSWKTKIAQVKVLPKGHSIGYGLSYITRRKTKIAVIPQGYADGLPRALSNKGEVLIGGTRCKILGRISMNMFVADVSHLSRAEAEDEVVIIGKQSREQITVEEIAKRLDTINYEITTRISPLLPRVVV